MMKKLFWRALRQITFWEGKVLCAQFEKGAKNFSAVQEAVLLKKIKRAKNSLYGKKFGFSQIHSVQEYQAKVPLSKYEDLSPYLEKVRNGFSGALLHPKEKILMFALSSGTTGEPKAIPVTPSFLKEYKQGSLLWGVRAAMDHSNMLDGKILTIVSPAHEEETGLGISCGAISGLIAENQKSIARMLYPVPGPVFEIKDTRARDYLILRFTLAEKLCFLTTANPSTLIRLARSAQMFQEALIKDIYEGTITPPGEVPEKWLRKWRQKMTPNRGVGISLQNILQKGKLFYPRYFWPHLCLLACWKGGTLSSYLPQVQEFYGNVPIRDLGLLASEGRMTLPLQDEGSAGVLDFMHHFFEFIPEEEEHSPNPKILLGEELEKGKNYFLVLTTSSGLYRYQIHDLVQVEDFFHKAPKLKFLNKGKSFSSLTGEKISEFQVVQAVQCAAMEQEIALERFILAPNWGDPPHYVLVVEEAVSLESERWEKFLKSVEQKLRNLNGEYQSKRLSFRLADLELRRVPVGIISRKDTKLQKRRLGREEQFKPSFLSNDLQYLKNLIC